MATTTLTRPNRPLPEVFDLTRAEALDIIDHEDDYLGHRVEEAYAVRDAPKVINRRLPIVPEQDRKLAADLAWDHHHYIDEPAAKRAKRIGRMVEAVFALSVASVVAAVFGRYAVYASTCREVAIATHQDTDGKVRGLGGHPVDSPAVAKRRKSSAKWGMHKATRS